MQVRPDTWPVMVVGEGRLARFRLAPALQGATVTGVTWECIPPGGLTFADESHTADGGQTVTATMTAVRAGEYVVIATCSLSDGGPVKPRVRQRVVCAGDL